MKLNILICSILALTIVACTSNKEKLITKIKANEKALLSDSMITPNEDSIAAVLISDYQTFAKENAADSLAPDYLFKAADISKNTRKYKQAIDCWGLIISKYPESSRAAYSLFLQAFTYQTAMNDTIKSKLIFKDFIAKYPTHPFVKDAKFSIEQMEGKLSDDEIVANFLKNLEDKNKKK
jgi:outer membrane protein assembly factor BamD (BamD/ComL family)